MVADKYVILRAATTKKLQSIYDDYNKQTDTEGDLCEPVRDVLDERSKLD